MAEKSVLIVKGLTNNITKEHLHVVLENKRRKGGGHIEHIELIENGDTNKAIVTFKEAQAVDIILNRGNTIEINDVIVRVKRWNPQATAPKKSKTAKAKKLDSDSDLSGNESFISKPDNKINITTEETSQTKIQHKSKKKSSTGEEYGQETHLKQFISTSPSKNNKRRTSRTDDSSDSEFEQEKCKNKTTNSFTDKKLVNDQDKKRKATSRTRTPSSCSDSGFDVMPDSESSRRRSSSNTDLKTKLKNKKSVNNKKKNSIASSQKSDTEQSSDFDNNSENESSQKKTKKSHTKTKQETNKFKTKSNQSVSKKRQESSGSSEESDLEGQWQTTIKAQVKDLNEDREFYNLYFEDESVSQGPFYEDTLMLDGLNRNLYVTFHTKKAARATAEFKHNPDESNLLKVEMAKKEDFETYNNLLSVHGFFCDNDEQRFQLVELVSKKTQMDVVGILQQDEPRSAIIVFNPQTSQDISSATWKSLCYNDEKLILAPVYKSNCLKISSNNSLCSDQKLKFYFSNKKRSGGGKFTFFQRLSDSEALIFFENRETLESVLAMPQHELEDGSELHITIYHQCLSSDVYEKQILGKGHHVTETNCVTKTNKVDKVKRTSQQLPSKDQSPSPIKKAPPQKLNCAIVPLYTEPELGSSKNVHYMMTLCKFGTTFLTKHLTELQELLQSKHCKLNLLPLDQLTLHLNWPEKLKFREVQEKLKSGLKILCNFLDTFVVVAIVGIDASCIYEFQTFCQIKCQKDKTSVEVFIDHLDNSAAFFSNKNKPWLENVVNKIYQDFLSSIPATDKVKTTTFSPRPKVTPRKNLSDKIKNNNLTDKGEIDKEKAVDANDVEQEQLLGEKLEFDLEEKDLIMFQKTNYHKDLEKKFKPLEIIFNDDNKHVVIKGKDKQNLLNAQLELYKQARNCVRLNTIKDTLTPEQKKLLEKEDVQHSINQIFTEKQYEAHFQCNQNTINLYFMNGVNEKDLVKIIKSHVEIKKISLDSDSEFTLTSVKGKKFLSDLCISTDGIKLSSSITFQQNSLLIISLSQNIDKIENEINNFMKENKFSERIIPFSNGKQIYMKKFLHEAYSEIEKSLKAHGVKIIPNPDNYTIQGLKDGISEGEMKLTSLSEKILSESIRLKFFGINEFLQTREGKSLLASVESNQKCSIINAQDSKSEFQKSKSSQVERNLPTKAANLVSQAEIEECSFSFLQGDITSLDIEAIVHPLDSTLQFHSGLGKALNSKGGPRIQAELTLSNIKGIPGEVADTSAGSLSNCKRIIHVVCPVVAGTVGATELEKAIFACLSHAESIDVTSLAMSAIGTGKIFKFQPIVACMVLIRTLQNHLSDSKSRLRKICFCDFHSENVKILKERFSHFFKVPVDEVGELQEDVPKAHSPSTSKPPAAKAAKSPTFKNFKVKLVTGEIAKQTTDVIVVTVGKSLDLSKNAMTKDIVKLGGEAVQQELTSNCGDEINPGKFGTTSGGNLQCKNIYYARLCHWKGNEESFMSKLVYKMLEQADEQKAASVSIPAMGTGSYKYPPNVAANAITHAISQFDMDNSQTSLKLINVVVYPTDTPVKQAFESVLKGSEEAETSAGYLTGMFQKIKRSFVSPGDNKHEKQFKSVKLIMKKGDLMAEKCDAIVCGIRETLDLSNSGAVSKTLLKKCGTALQDECNSKKEEMVQHGFIETSAPNLNCKKIYHVSMDKFKRSWDRCVSQILKEAEDNGLTSIAMPALGLGSKNADYQQIKQKIFSGVDYFSKRSQGTLKDVRLVIYDQNTLDKFVNEDDSQKHDLRHHYEAEAQKLKKVSEHVDLKIYSENHQTIINVKNELKTVFKQAFKEKKEQNENVKRLNREQVHRLELEGLKHCVKVSINVEDELITMQSFIVDKILQVYTVINKQLIEAFKNYNKDLQKAVKAAIVWQFFHEGKWRNFEPLLNSELELHKDKSSHHDIHDSVGRTWRVDFSKMKEYIVNESGQKQGRSIKVQRKDTTKEGPLPCRWESMGDDENLKMVTLTAGSHEYKSAEDLFIKGGANMPVKKIQRIQNKALYQQYKAKMQELEKRNPKGHKNEQRLFHGTDIATVTCITENGFNRSFCGKNATVHGNGVYFAVTSAYSVSFAKPSPSGDRHMFIARVLTGVSTPSSQGMMHLPNQPGTNTPYDSGSASGMFIMYHDAQTYPEYLITF